MGSEGSHPDSRNIRTDYDHSSLEQYTPKSTDHPFAVAPGTEIREPLEAEKLRREANKRRDMRKRWRNVPNGPRPNGSED